MQGNLDSHGSEDKSRHDDVLLVCRRITNRPTVR